MAQEEALLRTSFAVVVGFRQRLQLRLQSCWDFRAEPSFSANRTLGDPGATSNANGEGPSAGSSGGAAEVGGPIASSR